MRFPSLVVIKTRHREYNFNVTKDNYKKVGLEILSIIKLHGFVDKIPNTKITLKSILEDKLDLPLSEIEALLKSPLAEKILLTGKKSSVYESGYNRPQGSNIKEQVALIKKHYELTQERIEYCKKANAPITKLNDGDIWDIVEYFLGGSLSVQSYDNDMV